MCGISGTIVNKNFHLGIIVTPEELYSLTQEIKAGKSNVDRLLEKTWEYKSNINFLRYVNDELERESIKKVSDLILKLANQYLSLAGEIDKKVLPQVFIEKYEEYEKLLDCYWFLSNEVKNWFLGLSNLVNSNIADLEDHTIIFLKS